MDNFPLRFILRELRDGDYAHAGDTDAINRVVEKALSFESSLKSGPTLDIGCGLKCSGWPCERIYKARALPQK